MSNMLSRFFKTSKDIAEGVGTARSAFRSLTETGDDDAGAVSAPSGEEFDESAYQDADGFEESIRSGLKETVGDLAAADPAAAKEVLNNFVRMAEEVAKFTEVQKTKRKAIEAKRDVIVERIKSEKEIILAYLDKSFDERRENFARLFSVVDSALANNNTQQLALGLDSINKLAAASPFKELASIESTKMALQDKSHEWDF